MTGNVSSTYSFATHAGRVKVDPETGKVKVLKFVAAHDVGRVINRLGLVGQIEGAIAQGLGYALTEQMQFEKGKLLNNSYTDYKMLLSRDMPRDIEIVFIETNDPEGPYGAKGVSEAGLIPTPAALANAVADAIGVRMHEMPLSPERILQVLRKKK
jgi:xanthine dehydrogenase molybdenum-binding subunit